MVSAMQSIVLDYFCWSVGRIPAIKRRFSSASHDGLATHTADLPLILSIIITNTPYSPLFRVTESNATCILATVNQRVFEFASMSGRYQYVIERFIAKGSYGKAYLCRVEPVSEDMSPLNLLQSGDDPEPQGKVIVMVNTELGAKVAVESHVVVKIISLPPKGVDSGM